MHFVDELTLRLKAGRGGDGVVRWLSEKFKEYSGPAGGDGGNGGDVLARAVRNTFLLGKYAHIKEMLAENGQPGENRSKKGRQGEDLFIDFPIGSIITNNDTGEVYRLDEEGQTVTLLKGGKVDMEMNISKHRQIQNPKNLPRDAKVLKELFQSK